MQVLKKRGIFMDNREKLDLLESASSKLEKTLSFNQIIYEFITKDISNARDAQEALSMLTQNREHYAELLNETFNITDEACNDIEKVIMTLNEEEESSSVN